MHVFFVLFCFSCWMNAIFVYSDFADATPTGACPSFFCSPLHKCVKNLQV